MKKALAFGACRCVSRLAALWICLGVVSCGGGGHAGDSAGSASLSSEDSGDGAALHGMAYATALLPNATVGVKDAAGHEYSSTTDALGSFTISGTIEYPALIKVEVPGAGAEDVQTLYAVVDIGTSDTLYVTPLSTAQVGALSRSEPAVLYKALGLATSARAALAIERIQATEQAIRSRLRVWLGAQAFQDFAGATDRVTKAAVFNAVAPVKQILTNIAHILGLGDLTASVAAQLANPLIGCEILEIGTLSDGALRPACRPGSNAPLSWTFSQGGGFLPVKAESPPSTVGWADMLSGVNRDVNWKFYEPIRDETAVHAALVAKLKSVISDIWSGDKGIWFPESYDYDHGTVQRLVNSVIDIEWEVIGTKIKARDVSNLTFEFQALRTLLAKDDTRKALFQPLIVESVKLAVPNGLDSDRYLTAMGADIKAFAMQWLSNPQNQQAQVVTAPEVQAVMTAFINLWNNAAMMAMVYSPEASAKVKALVDNYVAAAEALPNAYSGLRQPTIDDAQWSLKFFEACAYSIGHPSDADQCLSLGEQHDPIAQAFSAAYNQAAQASAKQETAGDFYARFLSALAEFMKGRWENHFEAIYRVADFPSFQPVIVLADFYDGVGDPACCLSSDERAAKRDGSLYLIDATKVKFNKLSLTGGAMLNMAQEVPIARMDFQAGALDGPRQQKLMGPIEVVVDWASKSVATVLIGCSGADTACIARLSKSRSTQPHTTMGPFSLNGSSAALWGTSRSIRDMGGISEAVSSVDLRPPTGP